MKYGLKWMLLAAAGILLSAQRSEAQTYVKLTGLYALVGVINPAVEFRLSPHSTFQSEFVCSPWKSIEHNGAHKPMLFGIFMNEYRRYFKQHNTGWYVGANVGMMAFKMSKPTFAGGKLGLQDRYSKGYGLMFGVCGGYEYRFADRWLLDVYFGWAYMASWYNGYNLDGTVQWHPHRRDEPEHPDPFNGSGEWLPNKIGVSIGLMIFNPDKHRKKR